MPFIYLQTPVSPKIKGKLQILLFIFGTLFLTLTVYLGYLQLIKGDELFNRALKNSIRIIPVKASRGLILDRFHKPLTTNREIYSLYITWEDIKNKEQEVIGNIQKIFGIKKDDLEFLRKNKSFRPYQPQKLLGDISKVQLTLFEENKQDLPGVSLREEYIRDYSLEGIAAHTVGYLNQISNDQMKSLEKKYAPGDLIGKSGLEQYYEDYLQGRNGGEEVEVDTWGRKRKSLAREEPVPGANLVTTLDLGLQQLVERLLENKAGAIVVMDPMRGEILAMASSPKFDPNIFIGRLSMKDWRRLSNNPYHPLLNRIIQGQYSPGSTFKLITAIAGLTGNSITKDTKLECKGELTIGNKVFRCWKKDGHGQVDLEQAIKYSCNIYFYQLGLKIGIQKLVKAAEGFNLGISTGIDLFSELSGFIPFSDKKESSGRPSWFLGNTAQLAMGQGAILVTPMQLAVYYSALANGGIIYRPYLVNKIMSPKGEILREFFPSSVRELSISPEILSFIRNSLWKVVNEQGGTGGRAHIPGLDVAGKTGTVQLVNQPDMEARIEDLPYNLRPHSWFACFAPADYPKLCVVVLIEHGGEGSSSAAPLAREIVNHYLKDEPRNFDREIKNK